MSVVVRMSPILRAFTDNTSMAEVRGATVRECLDNLAAKFPRLKGYIYDKNGNPMLIILLNGQAVTGNKLDTKVSGSDEISVFIPVDGG